MGISRLLVAQLEPFIIRQADSDNEQNHGPSHAVTPRPSSMSRQAPYVPN
jgi:hypothetical protein